LIQEIFSVPIYKIKLDLDVNKLELFCNKYQHKNKGRVVSNRGGYQSKDLSLADVTLQPLIEAIKTHSNQFAKTFVFLKTQKKLIPLFAQWQKDKNREMLDTFYNNKKQIMSNIWFNTNSCKDSNVSHNHGGFDISGVFYIKTPEGCGDIKFKHPAQDLLDYYFIDVKQSEQVSTYSKKTWCLPSVANMLYLFPSWLYHSVKSNCNKAEKRISMSFNI
jgi:uncharacterized protein (TIGR02466 family)